MRSALLYIILVATLAFSAHTVDAATTINKPTNMLGLVGYWTFDGKDMIPNVRDLSGNGNHGNLSGQTSTTSVAGRIGQGLSFGASGDYVSLGDMSQIEGQSKVTWSLWVKDVFTGDGSCYLTKSNPNFGTGEVFEIRNQPSSWLGTTNDLQVFLPANVGDNHNSSYSLFTSGQLLVSGEWNHVVAVFDGTQTGNSNRLKAYINGVQVSGSYADTIPATTQTSSVDTRIGMTADGICQTNASIDDVRIYTRTLSASEITALYNQGAAKFNATKSSGTLGTSGLVGHWTFDGKNMVSNVADISGQGNHGSLSGQTSTTSVAGKIGQALAFDGVNDYVSVGSSAAFVPTTWTISAWVYLNATSPDIYGVFAVSDSGAWSRYFRINNSVVEGGYFTGNGENKATGGTLTAGRWYFIAYTSDGANSYIWTDGVAGSPTAVTSISTTARPTTIGGNWAEQATNWPMNGKIDDVRIYNRALSAAEIKQLHTMGESKFNATQSPGTLGTSGLVGHWTFDGKNMVSNVADTSGQGNHGSLSGQTSTTSVAGKIGQALSFDGINDHVDAGSSSVYDIANGTISLWFKLSSLPGSTPTAVFAKDQSGLNDGDLNIQWGQKSSDNRLTLGMSPGGVDAQIFSDDPMVTNTWYHAVVTVGSGGMKMYVNGVEQADTDSSTGGMTNPNPSVIIGSLRPSTWPFPGSIDDVRIYNRALTAAEVKQLYNLGR